MIKHAKCNETVLIDVTDLIKLYGYPVASINGIAISELFISCEDNEIRTYFCVGCNENVPVEELLFQCSETGNFYPLKDMVIDPRGRIISDAAAKHYKLKVTKLDKLLLVS